MVHEDRYDDGAMGGDVADGPRADARTAVVVFGGGRADLEALSSAAASADVVIAADSGASAVLAAGASVDIVVGDMDSIDPSVLARIERGGARIERHPTAKDATDLELAIDAAIATGATRVRVIGGHGGRVDQSFANVFILAAPRYAEMEMHAVLDSAQVSVVHGGGAVTFVGSVGDVVSILPMHGDAHGVHTIGLEYPLRHETLPAGTSRGVSNVQIDREVTVAVGTGTVVVVRPGREVPLSAGDGFDSVNGR